MHDRKSVAGPTWSTAWASPAVVDDQLVVARMVPQPVQRTFPGTDKDKFTGTAAGYGGWGDTEVENMLTPLISALWMIHLKHIGRGRIPGCVDFLHSSSGS